MLSEVDNYSQRQCVKLRPHPKVALLHPHQVHGVELIDLINRVDIIRTSFEGLVARCEEATADSLEPNVFDEGGIVESCGLFAEVVVQNFSYTPRRYTV